METWQPLLRSPAYEASESGKIRSVGPRTRKRVLRQFVSRWGYCRVGLGPGNRKYEVHRLVWEAFNGPIPGNLEINHKNGIKADNRLVNLETCTRRENHIHAARIGLRDVNLPPRNLPPRNILLGETNPAARLTTDLVRELRRLHATGLSGQAAARQLGLKYRTAHHVLSGRYWSHVD